MKLHVLGGAGEYGRSCYLLEHEGSSLLLDCGVKRSRNGKQAGEYPLLTPELARQADWLLLSHAHEDHCAAIPFLYQSGYTGKVYGSEWTAAQARRVFHNWKATVERFGGTLPYGENAVEQVVFAPLADFLQDARTKSLELAAGRSGHLPGALWFLLTWHGKTVFYSGDFHFSSRLFAFDMPKAPAEIAILDAAYGADSLTREEGEAQLLASIQKVTRRKGKVLLPLPQAGRSQEILAFLLQRGNGHDELKRISWIVEKSIWDQWLAMMQDKRWCHSQKRWDQTGEAPSWVRVVSSEEERKSALVQEQPQLIFTTDGMMNNAVSSFWLERIGNDSANAIVLTGHQAPGTVGEQAVRGLLKLRSEVVNIRYKVHPNLQEIVEMTEALQAKQVILVHQNRESLLELKEILGNQERQVYLLSAGDQLEW